MLRINRARSAASADVLRANQSKDRESLLNCAESRYYIGAHTCVYISAKLRSDDTSSFSLVFKQMLANVAKLDVDAADARSTNHMFANYNYLLFRQHPDANGDRV